MLCETAAYRHPISVSILLQHACSDTLSLQHFQLLEPAAAILSALKAHHIPVALVVPVRAKVILRECLEQANLTQQFAAVVSSQGRIQDFMLELAVS